MQAYKKRAKGGWRQGKGYKGDGEERQYSKTEIRQQLAEAEENYLEKYHKGARTKNMRARLEYRISWYEELNAKYKGSATSVFGHWFMEGLKKAKEQLAKLEAKEGKK